MAGLIDLIPYKKVSSEEEMLSLLPSLGRGLHIIVNYSSESWYLSDAVYLIQKRITGADVSWSQNISILSISGTVLKFRSITGNQIELVYGDWKIIA